MDCQSTIQVGYSRICITPEESVPMGGYFNSSFRMSQNVLDDIYATCIAISDIQNNTVLMVNLDMTRSYNETLNQSRQVITEATGIPPERLLISATHTHSGPDLSNTAEPSIQRYTQWLLPRLAQVCVEALEDRKHARIFVGHTATQSLNYVRHYRQTLPDGTVSFLSSGSGKRVPNAPIAHTTEADPTMHLVKFLREGGKDVVLVNWRAHPALTGGGQKFDLSSDFVGPFRQVLEAQQDCLSVFLQGGGGNINPHSRIKDENYTKDHRVYGARLAYFAVKGLENMTEVAPGQVQIKRVFYPGKVNHAEDHLLEFAKQAVAVFNHTGDKSLSIEAGAPYIRSPYHALSIVERYNKKEDIILELNAVSVGSHLAFVSAPNELFDTNTKYVEEHSPFSMTMSLSLTNGYEDYLPSRYAFTYTCYETDSSRFCPGLGEEVQDTLLQMLQDLHAENRSTQ